MGAKGGSVGGLNGVGGGQLCNTCVVIVNDRVTVTRASGRSGIGVQRPHMHY